MSARELKRRRLRNWLVALAVSAALSMVVAGFAIWNAKRVLSKDSGPVKADIIIVLGGGWNERSDRAAELFKAQAAPCVFVSGSGDCETNRRLLIAAGVPPDVIETECQSRSTKENALFTIRMLRERGMHRAILVTTWYHSRRALACFRHYAPDIEFYSRPSFYASERSEWKRKAIGAHVRMEYLKLAGYWVCYGVPPW